MAGESAKGERAAAARPSRSRPRTHKDQLFKTLFARRFPELMRMIAPRLARRLDLERAVAVSTGLFSQEVDGDVHFVDLLHEVPIRPRDGERDEAGGDLVFVHIETEGRWIRKMRLRMCDYFMLIWRRFGRTVIPIVVFLKGGPPGIRLNELVVEFEGVRFLTFQYFGFGLEKSDAEPFLERDEPLAAALAAWMRSSLDRVRHRLECYKGIAQARLTAEERVPLFNCVDTALSLEGSELDRFEEAMSVEMRNADSEDVREALLHGLTWADVVERRGEARGRREGEAIGRQAGEAIGRMEGMRNMLLRLLDRRFGPLGDIVRVRVAAVSSVEHLERLADQALSARSLAELDLPANGSQR